MRRIPPLLLVCASSVAASCAFLSQPYRPPHAPRSEASKVKFPWGSPRETVFLTGVWLRAVTMALDDFLPEEESERARGEDPEGACLARRDSYSVEAFVWSPEAEEDGSDGGEMDLDGGAHAEPDAGYDYSITQPGMPRNPSVIYVSIGLAVDCNPGGSPLMDVGALYAIDTVNWRILAIHH